MGRSALPISVGAPASLVALGFLAIVLAVLPQQGALPDPTQALSRDTSVSYAQPPLSFIPNRGQTDESVRYYAQGAGFGFYFTDDKAVLSFEKGGHGQALQLRFLGASANATLRPRHQGAGTVNYLRGDDPRKWQTGLPTYGQLAYQKLWPGVDMFIRGAAGGTLKYEFKLASGANPDRIRLAYAGAEGLSLSRGGNLSIRTPHGTLRDSAPRAWQQIGGRKVPVQSRYALNNGGRGANAYGFELGAYDRSHPLVIDPGVVYSTYLGGTGTDLANAIAVDAAGSSYVTGRTSSPGFPTTPGAFDTTPGGSGDAFVTKLAPDGSTLAYSTYLGGAGGSDEANGIAVDGAGRAYVTGSTNSSDFPTTAGAFDTTLAGSDDAFVTKLEPDGSALAYSTYLGGNGNADYGNGIAFDGAGSAFVTGYTVSANFPTTPGAYDTTFQPAGNFFAFLTKLVPDGSALDYSTFLGGSGGTNIGNDVAVDGADNAYVTGSTLSSVFPTTGGAFDTTHNGGQDAFVTKFDAAGSSLLYSTYLGGTGTDGSSSIALDASGRAHLTGFTNSSGFPTTASAFDTTYNDDGDAFVTKLTATGSALSYSTFLGGTGAGGTGYDSGSGIAVDGTGSAWVTGRTDSVVYPTTAGAFDTIYGPVGDAFVTKVSPNGTALSYSTYLGGSTGGTGGTDQGSDIALGGVGDVYVAGYTTSNDFPTTAGAFDTSANGGNDAFVWKFFAGAPPYPRPGGATPLRVSLVPEYQQCTQPNNTHIGPLDGGSCSPIAQSSTLLTTSTIGKGSGYAIFRVQNGNPGTPADEADVTIEAALSDVRNAAGDGDYTGRVILTTPVRMTDTRNGFSGEEPATVSDFELSAPIDCVATPAPEIGSNCNISTTLDTLVPGSVKEGSRAVVSTFSVSVEDAGPDGVIDPSPDPLGLGCPPTCGSGDEAVYLRQGIFTP
jgi:Beta-propeller repeat